MFEDVAQYSAAAELERNWEIIRDEMVALRSTGFIAWPEKSLYGETGWSTFGLYAFGQKQPANCALCPRTTALVEGTPGLVTAGFSRLAPGTHIKPHVGYDEYSRYVLRLHLALETNADCALRVAEETRRWVEGKTLIFCDAVEHEAWNRGTTTRTVLLLDFKNPRYRFRILNPSFSPEFVAEHIARAAGQPEKSAPWSKSVRWSAAAAEAKNWSVEYWMTLLYAVLYVAAP